ncbi:spore protease YyaC [Cytobacillus sp. FJAT-54145]|uniref:Spore protease YyaC n=1 Tax=Cytobacillus spartinae TaxID=3299023 RepID=A0ABW6KCS2_9BACI
MSYVAPSHPKQSTVDLIPLMKEVFPCHLPSSQIAFVCIGTDRATGDCLGPLVGTFLKEKGYPHVYGTLDSPVHFKNIQQIVSSIPKGKTVIAIDCTLGKTSEVGDIRLFKGSVSAGAITQKQGIVVGDYGLLGVVNIGGYMEPFMLQCTPLNLVMNMAKTIAETISKAIVTNRSSLTQRRSVS